MANDDVDPAAYEQSDNDSEPAGGMPPPISFAEMPPPISFDEMPPPISFADMPMERESSAAGAFGRAAGIEAIPFAASLAPMAAGARAGGVAGAAVAGPAGGFVGGLLGGAVAGGVAAYAAQKAQKAAGIELDPEQEAADEAQHPWARTAGRLFPNVVAFSPGRLADSLAHRVLMGAGMGAVDIGQQAALNGGSVDVGQVAEAAVVGGVFSKSNRLGAKFTGPGERFADRVMGSNGKPLPTPTAEEDHRVADTSEAPKNGVGVAQSQPKPIESDTVGNPQSTPVPSERVYGNREARRAQAAARLAAEQAAEGDVDAATREALAPANEPVVEAPASHGQAPEAARQGNNAQQQEPPPPIPFETMPQPPERQRMLPPVNEEHALDTAAATRQGVERAQAPRPEQVGELFDQRGAEFDRPNAVTERVPEAQSREVAAPEAPVREPVSVPEPVSAPAEIRPQPEQRPIDYAIEVAKTLDQSSQTTQHLLAVLNKARENPKLADIVAKRFLAEYGAQEKAKSKVSADVTAPERAPESRTGEANAGVSKDTTSQEPNSGAATPKTDKSILDHNGRVVGTASTVALANRRTYMLKLAKEVQDRHAFPDTDPRNAEQVKALREKAIAALADAEEKGYKSYLPKEQKVSESGPKEHREAPPAAVWMAEVKAFALGKRKPEDFIAREKLLRAGDEQSADIVRSERLTQAAEFYRPHRGEAAEVTSEGNIAPKNIDAMGKPDEGVFSEFAGKRYRLDAAVQDSAPLRERLTPEELPEHSDLAKAVVAQEPGVKVHTIDHEAMDEIGKRNGFHALEAYYDAGEHAIFVRPGASQETIFHEAIHAVTSRRLHANPKLAAQIEDFMASLKGDLGGKHDYAMSNPREFLAHAMSDIQFQGDLANIKITPEMAHKLGLAGRIRDGFQAFVDMVRRVIGLPEGTHSALEAAIKLTDTAMRAPLPVNGRPTFGKRPGPENTLDAAVQTVRDQADSLLKQLKGAALLKIRDTYNISRSADRVFGGADNNPTRAIADHTEQARVRSLELAREWDDHHKLGLELRAKDPAGFQDMEALMQLEGHYQRYGDLPLNQHPYNTKGTNEEFKNARHPDLESRWNALSDDLKQYRDDAYERFQKEHEALAEQTAASRLLKELGLDDKALAKRVMDGNLTAADFQRLGPDDLTRQTKMEIIQEAGEISKLVGPYSPAMRRGRYAVTGEFKVPGTDQALRETVPHHAWEFDTKQKAVDFAILQEGRPHIDSYYVDATTGDRTTKVTEPVMKDGVEQKEPGSGRPLMHDREIPLSKNDPNTVQRWQVRVDRGYLKMLDTRAQALAHEAELHQSGSFDKTDSQPKMYQPHTDAVTLASNLTNLEAKLKNNALYENMTPAQKASVKQLLAEHYLQMMAATRVHSSKLHRNFVKGADDDIIRNTLDWAGEVSNRRGRMEHQNQIDDAFAKAKEMVNEDNVHSHARRAIVNELEARHDAMKDGGFRLASGQMGPFQQRLMSWSYTARLATPGFTIRNLTQPGLFLAEIAGKHGYGAGFRELGRVYRDMGAGTTLKQGLKDTARAAAGKLSRPETLLEDVLQRPNISADDKFAIKYMVERGRIDPDAGFAMGETIRRPEGIKLDFFGKRRENILTRGVEGGLNALDTGLHWIEEVSRQMPRAAETVNRVGMGLTAFRLEMKRNGGDREKAARYADDAVAKTQFIYSDTNKPTWQRNPFARAAFQFKQFGKSTYEFLGRHIAQSIDSQATPDERSASRKALGGLFVTHTLVAGALGLPWEPVRALLIGAKQLGWTNKEWDDVENGIREAFTGFGNLVGLNEKNAKRLGEVLARGMPRLAGIDLSPGLGLDNMILSISRSGTDREMDNNLSAWLFNMAAGAPTALQVQAISGVRDLMHGEYAKGVEKLSPMKLFGDIVKAGVGLSEGKKNARGRETAPAYTPYQAGVKAMGLPVGEEAERNTYQHQVYQKGTEERTTKSKLIADWLKADTPAAKDKASRAAFDGGVKPLELTQALQRERSADKRVVDGVMTTKATRPIAERLGKVYNFTQE